MSEDKKNRTVYALFTDQEAAERGINQAVQAGFGPDDISYLGPSDAEEPNYARNAAAGIGTGGVVGGAIGAVLGAVTVGAIPGIGPVLVAGALLPTAVLAMTGASAGATMGALFAGAASQDQALYYMQEVQSGRSLVTITTDRPAEAADALRAAGAMEVADAGTGETARKMEES